MPVTRRQMLVALASTGTGAAAGCADRIGGSNATHTFVTPDSTPRQSPVAPHPDACGPPPTPSDGAASGLSATVADPSTVADCSRVAVLTECARDFVTLTVEYGSATVGEGVLPTDQVPPLASFPYVEVDGAIFEPAHETYGMSGPRVVELGEHLDRRPLTGTVVEYGDLSRAEKQVASEALQQGRVTLDHHDPSLAWAREADYLAFDGAYYPLTTPRSTGDDFPHHHVSLRPVRDEVPDGARVVQVRPRVARDVERVIAAAVEHGETTDVPPRAGRFVRKHHYALTVSTLYRLDVR